MEATGEWKGLVYGATVGVLGTMLLVGICAVLIVTGVLPGRAGDGGVLLACAVGGMIGGRLAARGQGRGGLLYSVGAAVLSAIIFGVSGFLLYNDFEIERCITITGACLCGGGLAGITGTGRRKRRIK